MDSLKKAFDNLKIQYDDLLVDRFRQYMEGILQWNEKVNLTAIKDKEEFVEKHFIDSILCYNLPEMRKANKIIDVGTGGGFPGIPLALVLPDKEFVLMDSLNKRLKIIDELASEIGITNIRTLHGRAEELAHKEEYREQFDLCVSRAVARLSVLSEYCLPYIKQDGAFLAYKAVKSEEEIQEGRRAIRILGGEIDREESVTLPSFELSHKIIVIKKERKTPRKYPRKAGLPSKQPLI